MALATAPILAFPDFDKTFYIQGDASSKAVGGACLQKHDKTTVTTNKPTAKQTMANPKRLNELKQFYTEVFNAYINQCTLALSWIFRPNNFFGRKLTKTERRWSATERELLALVYGYEVSYHLVFGRKIIFLTDHKPLATLKD